VIAKLLARHEVLVGWLTDPWCCTCYGWGRQLLGCHCSYKECSSYLCRDTVLATIYEHHYHIHHIQTDTKMAKAVQGGDRSNIGPLEGRMFNRSWPGVFDRWV